MDSNTLITAISGLVGVLIGGGITMWATWWSARVQREHHNRAVQHEKVTAIWDYLRGDTWREHGQNYLTAMHLQPETRHVGTYPTLGDRGERLAQSALLHIVDPAVREQLDIIETKFHQLHKVGKQKWVLNNYDPGYPGAHQSAMDLEDKVTELTQVITDLANYTREQATGQK